MGRRDWKNPPRAPGTINSCAAALLACRYRSVPLALAAYNAGRGAVDRWAGLPLNRETPHYVRKVLTFFNEDAAARMSFAPVVVPASAQAVSLTSGGNTL